jgi:hypothetical protein
MAAPRPAIGFNENQASLMAFMEYMGKTSPTKAKALAAPARAVATGAAAPPADPQAAKANFQDWLAQTESDGIPRGKYRVTVGQFALVQMIAVFGEPFAA